MKKIFKNPRLLIFLSGVFVVVILTIVGVWAALNKTDQNVIAILGDKQISRTEYNDMISRCQGFASFAEDKDLQNDCQKFSLDKLIEIKALEIEAEKRGIAVSSEEVEKEYQEKVETYGGEENYKEMLAETYKTWTPGAIKINIKQDLLKLKLEPQLITKRVVWGPYVRWDYDGNEYKDKNLPEAKKMMEKYFSGAMQKEASKDDILAKIAELRKEGEPWVKEAVSGLMDFSDLNEATAKERFAEEQDWAAISKLGKVGNTTDIVESQAGYVVIYKLTEITAGQYNSWDDFLKAAIEKTKAQALDARYLLVKSKIKESVKTAYQNAKQRAADLAAPKKADARTPCSAYHFSALRGQVRDYNTDGWSITGVKIHARHTEHGSNTNGTGNGKVVGEYPYCTNTELGAEDIWTQEGAGGNFTLGRPKNASYRFMSCYTRWNIDITKGGYEGLHYRSWSVMANGTTSNIDHGYSDDHQYQGFWGFNAWANATNNDGDLVLRPIWHKLSKPPILANPTTVNQSGTVTFSLDVANPATLHSESASTPTGHQNNLVYKWTITADGVGGTEGVDNTATITRTLTYSGQGSKKVTATLRVCEFSCPGEVANSSTNLSKRLYAESEPIPVTVQGSGTGLTCNVVPAKGETPATFTYSVIEGNPDFDWEFGTAGPGDTILAPIDTRPDQANRSVNYTYSTEGNKRAKVTDSTGASKTCVVVVVTIPTSGSQKEVAP